MIQEQENPENCKRKNFNFEKCWRNRGRYRKPRKKIQENEEIMNTQLELNDQETEEIIKKMKTHFRKQKIQSNDQETEIRIRKLND